jgi:hypothetical protein
LVEREEDTYNFEVAEVHSYFVGISHAWVHNDCDPITLDTIQNTYGEGSKEFKRAAQIFPSLQGDVKITEEAIVQAEKIKQEF